LAHMMDDFRNGTGDDDLTHLPEILALHDMERDPAAGSKEQFRQRCLQNHSNRAIHHHVFDTASAIALVDHAGFQIVRVETGARCISSSWRGDARERPAIWNFSTTVPSTTARARSHRIVCQVRPLRSHE